MLLYRTGPASFNQFMRQIAMHYGWSLSEKGLIDHVTGEKVNVKQDTEEDIFKALNLPYLTPEQREHWEDFYDSLKVPSFYENSNEVISKLADWFRNNPEWKEIGLSLKTKDNVSALKGRLMGSSSRPKNLITHIVKHPYKFEISRAFNNAYGVEIN